MLMVLFAPLSDIDNPLGRNMSDDERVSLQPSVTANNIKKPVKINKYQEYEDEFNQRKLICFQAINIILDVPCFFMAIFVYLNC